jgi:hypothetical protein
MCERFEIWICTNTIIIQYGKYPPPPKKKGGGVKKYLDMFANSLTLTNEFITKTDKFDYI